LRVTAVLSFETSGFSCPATECNNSGDLAQLQCCGKLNFLISRVILIPYRSHWGTRRCSWLRHCAANRKVAGSIPDGVTGIFH
jgi:hypothetical protein